MRPWALPFFVLAVWVLWVLAAAAGRAAKDARRGLPEAQWGGVSLVPVIPVLPLGAWGLAWLIDHAANPWGSVFVGAAHAAFAVVLAVSLVRDWWFIRSIDGRS